MSHHVFVSSRISFNVQSGNREQCRQKLWILLRRDLFHLGVMESFLWADWTCPQVSQAWKSADSSYLPFSPAHALLHRLLSQAPKSQVLSLPSLSHCWALQTNCSVGRGDFCQEMLPQAVPVHCGCWGRPGLGRDSNKWQTAFVFNNWKSNSKKTSRGADRW